MNIMRSVKRRLHVRLLLTGGVHWMGGVQYTRNLVRAMNLLPKDEQPRVVLVVGEKNRDQGYETEFSAYEFVTLEHSHGKLERLAAGIRRLAGVGAMQRFLALTDPLTGSSRACSVAYPVKGLPLAMSLESVLWIPDFQYKCMPHYFSAEEIQQRNELYAAMLRSKSILVLSSESVRDDFIKFFPEYADIRVRILRFATLLRDEDFSPDPDELAKKYGLPEKFVYLPNQFFQHKRHDLAFAALARLQRQGYPIELVCTGNPHDYRSHEYPKGQMQSLQDNGLAGQVRLLGLLPRVEQLQLYRKAAFILQPSSFEGWSTSVEDAIALGKEIVLSDIPTHREQDPPQGKFFKDGCVDSLQETLLRSWLSANPGVDSVRERQARSTTRTRGLDFAVNFLDIMREAHARHMAGQGHSPVSTA